MRKLIFQEQDKGCGFACVKMMLVHFYKDKRYANIREPKFNESQPNLNTITDWAFKYGLKLEAFKLSDKADLRLNKQFPILLLIEENQMNHMVYLYKRIGKTYYLFDPENGKRKVAEDNILNLFTGIYLTAKKSRHSNPNLKSQPRLQTLSYSCCLFPFEAASLFFLFFGFYFISDSGNFLSPLLCFSAFVICKIMERYLAILLMKHFDKKYVSKIDSLESRDRVKSFKIFSDYKTAIFSGPIKWFSTLIEVLLLSVILVLNDEIYALGLGVSILITIVLFFALFNKQNGKKNELENLEAIYLGETSSKKEIKCSELYSKGYSFAQVEGLKESMTFFLDLVVCLLVCLFSATVSLNYMLFSFMTIYYIQNRIEYLLDSSIGKTNSRKLKAKFLGIFC